MAGMNLALPRPMAAPGQKVIVRLRLDGTLGIIHRGQPLVFSEISSFTNKDVTPPLGVEQTKTNHQTKLQRGHFYCAQKGDISNVV